MTDLTPRQIAERFIRDGIGRADGAVFDDTVADEVVVETGLSPRGPIVGRDAYKEVFLGFAESWPVRDFTVHRIDDAGATIVVEFTALAEFAREYYGVEATGQLVPMREIHRLDVMDGRIVRNTVAAVNLPFEFIMFPALKDAVLGELKFA